MILVLVLLLLIASPAALFALTRFNTRPGLTWLLVVLVTAVVWALSVGLAWQIPQQIPWAMWRDTAGLFGGPSWLVVDAISWPAGMAVSSLAFAAVLAAFSDRTPPGIFDLSAILLVTAFGLAAVYAGSISALLFAWTAMDLFELGILLWRVRDRKASERIVVAFSANLMGSLFLLLGAGISGASDLSLDAIPAGMSTLIVLAAGFRLGVLPAQPPLRPAGVVRPGLATLLRLAPTAGAVVLLARAAEAGVQPGWSIVLMVLASISALYGAINWFILQEIPAAMPFWRIGLSSLVVLAALSSLPEAVVGWGLTLIFGGGLVFLSVKITRGLFWLFALAGLLMFGLPFTPTWEASELIAGSGVLTGSVALLTAALLVGGYLGKMRAGGDETELQVRGDRVLEIAALVFLVVSLVFAGWAPIVRGEVLSGSAWAGFLIAGIVALGAYIVAVRGIRLFPADKELRPLLNLGVVYRMIWRVYRLTGRGVVFLTRLLEGRSAILWAILLLALLVSLIAQTGLGA